MKRLIPRITFLALFLNLLLFYGCGPITGSCVMPTKIPYDTVFDKAVLVGIEEGYAVVSKDREAGIIAFKLDIGDLDETLNVTIDKETPGEIKMNFRQDTSALASREDVKKYVRSLASKLGIDEKKIRLELHGFAP